MLAAGFDIILGAAIAFLLLRSRLAGRNLLDAIATLPLAIPGVVLAVGYLRVFHGWDFPGLGAPLTSSWVILVIAYTMRRLPYTVRAFTLRFSKFILASRNPRKASAPIACRPLPRLLFR